MIRKIVSGGQTGVDRAALDAAMEHGIAIGGWRPRGRRALDGPIPAHYPLTETRGHGYQTRTRWNVRDSDATLIICAGEPTGGTALTIRYCQLLNKPFFVTSLQEGHTPLDPDLLHWYHREKIHVLNIAGPRERKACPVYRQAHKLLDELFRQLAHNRGATERPDIISGSPLHDQ
ncbi:putative molybdenum carrier protein [Mariprofundus erugo]|uniref:putative molybdenum carrier protein n=1 Tax=Mariprofundus erugo TaxID=2528639 RepID=UPI00147818B6|nr:putative molybdenum carrier protein [Mariprofundus erugo]